MANRGPGAARGDAPDRGLEAQALRLLWLGEDPPVLRLICYASST